MPTISPGRIVRLITLRIHYLRFEKCKILTAYFPFAYNALVPPVRERPVILTDIHSFIRKWRSSKECRHPKRTGYIPSVLQSLAQHPIFCGQFFIDMQDRLVLCFFHHEKAMPYQMENCSPPKSRCWPPLEALLAAL